MFPPNSRGSLLFCRPASERGATASCPKKGRIGITVPQGSRASILPRSSAIWIRRGYGNMSGKVPMKGRKMRAAPDRRVEPRARTEREVLDVESDVEGE